MPRLPGTNGSNTELRGLTQYIADLRACRVRELEEKRINKEMAHIRQKFKEGNLDGYQKRKYLSKIVFTYVLGYQVDIGHMEAVNLISSSKYPEKQIGYLAITLLMHENSDLVRLVINSIRKDLDDMNEMNNCLALHAIANIGGSEMAEALASDVHRLLISPTSPTFVKKKAALTLLRLYRKYPQAIPAEEWALRIVSIMDDANLGVALSVTSLVMAMAQDHLEAFAICYQKAVHRLKKINIDHEYSSEYVYYKVPIPWLQVKLLRLLQYYPASDDPAIQLALHDVLDAILITSSEKPSNIQHSNALNAVLFEAINLAIHLDAESTVVTNAAQLLGAFITSKETNVRSLGLDAMTHLAARSDSLEAVKKHQETVLLSLRDKDTSVRRRGLDLLYSMCDVTNSKIIVGELLRYLAAADYSIREELTLKIAILTEKFAREYEWYVDTILRLMAQAGDHVGDEVWYRIIQIVTNTEEIQEYAARKVFDHLRSPTAHENLIKVAAYILGEFGHLVANDPGMSPIEQFSTLHNKSNLCSPPTRGLLLTTYIKWLNLFPEIKDQIIAVLEKYRYVLDAELQQRACEYLAIAKMPTDDLLQVVCDEMPPYPERESALLGRLVKKHGDASDKRTWHAGGREVNKDKDSERYKGLTKRRDTLSVPPEAAIVDAQVASGSPASPEERARSPPVENIMDSLIGLDLTPAGTPANVGSPVDERPLSAQPLVNGSASAKQELPLAPVSPAPAAPTSVPVMPSAPLIYTSGQERYIGRLLWASEGVLFEDGQLQIGLKSEYHGHLGRIAVYFGNKITAEFQSFTVTVESLEPDALQITLPKIASNTLQGMSQIQQIVQVEAKNVFTSLPVLRVSYLAGSLQEVTLRLPVYLTKFMEPVKFTGADFFERWKQIGGAPLEAQKVFPIRLTASGGIDTGRNSKIVGGCRFGLLEHIDPNPLNLVGAGVLHLTTGGKVGCLLRLEPNAAAKLCRLTIRSTNEHVSKQILDLLSKPLSNV